MTSAGIRERLLSPSRRRPTAMAKVKLQSGVIVSFQQIDTVAAGQSVTSSMRLLGM